MMNTKNILFTPDGAAIHYECTGGGTPLVLLHGNGQRQQVFERQTAYFKKRYRLILIDTRGHGRSTLGSRDMTPEVLAKDILFILDYLGIPKAILLGYSDGGNIALQLALAAPARLMALIVVSANTTPKGITPLIYFIIRMQYRLLCGLEKLHLPVKRHRLLAGLMALYPRIPLTRLRKLKLPTLIIAGKFDIIRKKHTLEIARAIPGSWLRIVKDAGHFGLFLRPAEYNAVIQNFLDAYHL